MQISVAVIGQMIEASKQMGGNPREIHMSPETLKAIAGAVVRARDSRSPLQRMMGAQAPQDLVAKGFYGLPVVEDAKFALGVIALRDEKGMGRDDWFEDAMEHQGGQVPWLERVKPEAPREEDPEAVSLKQLSTSPDKASPSDVLMKCFDGIEKVEDIIIIRALKNGSLELSSTCSRVGLMGGLQLAMSYVIQGN